MHLGEKDAHKHHARRRHRRRIAHVTAAIIIILFILMLVGLAYTWYASQEPSVSNETPVVTTTTSTITPTAPTAKSQVGVAVQSFTESAKIGGKASLSIKTLAKAACSIVFTYNDTHERANDTDLIPKDADEYGLVEWTWTVPNAVKPGKWPVEVTCAYDEKSAYSLSNLTVER